LECINISVAVVVQLNQCKTKQHPKIIIAALRVAAVRLYCREQMKTEITPVNLFAGEWADEGQFSHSTSPE
jgi:hypothetical protein